MKDDDRVSTSQAEQNMLTALRAEKTAEQAVYNCEREAQQLVSDAHADVQRLVARTDQRISDMEMRHSNKLNQLIKDIEKQGSKILGNDIGTNFDQKKLTSIIASLAVDLCRGQSDAVHEATASEDVASDDGGDA